VYDRRYSGKVLAFEPSGGLLNAGLVMRDRETDSWWSIITGDAIGGELEGTPLKEIAASEKARWGDWKRRYPQSKVLSVNGEEHDDSNPYDHYFASASTFRDNQTSDDRLPQKESIYAFQLNGISYAVPHAKIEGGAAFALGNGKEIFLYRKPDSEMYASTFSYISDYREKKSRFVNKKGRWLDSRTDAEFSTEIGFPSRWVDDRTETTDSEILTRLNGFDTFWYIWSATHEVVTILE
jgi:hypothetical protein